MLRPFERLRGCTLAASDGEVGEVQEFYFDDRDWTMRYLVVHTGSWLSGRAVLIIPGALGEIDEQGRTIATRLTREEVRNAPPFDAEKPVSRQHEERLHRHYDWNPHWLVPGAAGLGAYAPDRYTKRATVPESSNEAAVEKGDPHLRSSAELENRYKIHAQDGEIGRVHDFIIGEEDWRVRYLVVRTGVWFGKDVLVAPEWIGGISFEQGEVLVNLPRSAIKQAPDYNSRAPLSRSYEQRLHDHYGRKRYWETVEAATKS